MTISSKLKINSNRGSSEIGIVQHFFFLVGTLFKNNDVGRPGLKKKCCFRHVILIVAKKRNEEWTDWFLGRTRGGGNWISKQVSFWWVVLLRKRKGGGGRSISRERRMNKFEKNPLNLKGEKGPKAKRLKTRRKKGKRVFFWKKKWKDLGMYDREKRPKLLPGKKNVCLLLKNHTHHPKFWLADLVHVHT